MGVCERGKITSFYSFWRGKGRATAGVLWCGVTTCFRVRSAAPQCSCEKQIERISKEFLPLRVSQRKPHCLGSLRLNLQRKRQIRHTTRLPYAVPSVRKRMDYTDRSSTPAGKNDRRLSIRALDEMDSSCEWSDWSTRCPVRAGPVGEEGK